MNTYYDEVIEEIQSLMEKENYEEAAFVLKKELEMPYIPMDIEQKLHELQRELRFALAEKKETQEQSADSLLRMLRGNPQQQLRGAEGLLSKNLREFLPEIQSWLKSNPLPEASAIVIEELAKQNIDEEFVLVRDGVTYEFYSQDVVPVVEQEGFQKANRILQEVYLHHPDYYEMAKVLLIHEVYLFLPMSYDAEDGEGLAKAIQIQMKELLDQGDMAKN